jgi:hypothetical protein
MKLGRNAPCLCGSGRKLKRCCGTSGESVVVRAASIANELRPLLSRHHVAIRAAMREEIQVALATARSAPMWRDAPYDTDRVEHQLDTIHAQFRALLGSKGHDRQYWYLIARALAFDLFEDLKRAGIGVETNETLRDLLLSLTELSFACDAPTTPRDWRQAAGAQGIAFTPSAGIVIIAARIAALASLHYRTEAAYRSAGKGISLRAMEGVPSAADAVVGAAVHAFEDRKQRVLTVLGDAGFWFDAGTLFPRKPRLAGLWGGTHAKRGSLAVASAQPRRIMEGPYFPIALTEPRRLSGVAFADHPSLLPRDPWGRGTCLAMVPYDTLLVAFADTFAAALDLSAVAVASFLYALYRFIGSATGFAWLDTDTDVPSFNWPPGTPPAWRASCLDHARDALELGLIRGSRTRWVRGLAQALATIVTEDAEVPALTDEEMTTLFDRFTFEGPASRRRHGDPYLFWALSAKTVYFDFFGTERFLHDLFAATQSADKRPNGLAPRRGTFFEAQVRSFLTRELALDPRSIVAGVELGTSEIDLAFVVRRVLIVVECKARLKDAADLAGDFRKVRARLDVFAAEIDEKLPRRIGAIRAGRVANTIPPASFDRAVGLVCTPTVEYLPKEDTRFWAGLHPCVGSPEELVITIQAVTAEMAGL